MAIISKKLSLETEIEVSPVELFELFWEMDSQEQAEFFNALGKMNRLGQQMLFVADDPALTSDGRWAMSLIGDMGRP